MPDELNWKNKPVAVENSVYTDVRTNKAAFNRLKNSPEFASLTNKQWLAIEAHWDLGARGLDCSATAVAEIAGVSTSTIRKWRTDKDFLAASTVFGRTILHEFEPLLVTRSIQQALQGDSKLLMFYLERIYPVEKQEEVEQQKIFVSWGTPEIKVIETKVLPSGSISSGDEDEEEEEILEEIE